MSRFIDVRKRLPGNRVASRAPGPVFVTGLALAAIGVAIAATYFSFNAPNSIPLRSYYDIEAEFVNADNLAKHYQVRLGGRQVGQVLDPHVDDNKAVVKLRLDKDVAPLRSDTTLRIRPRSLIGVRFVELTPGTKGRELAQGDRIPATQTSATVQLDSVLDTFDGETRAQARRIAIELGNGVAGRGEGLGRTVGEAPQLLDDLRATAQAVNDLRPDSFGRLVQGASAAATASDPVRNDIAEGFRPQADALEPFADRAESVHGLLEQAPSTFSSGARNLAATAPVVRALNRFASSAGATLRPAPRAFSSVARLLDEARPGLRDAESALELADRAVDPTLDLLRTIDPVRPALDRAFTLSRPQLAELSPRRCDLRQFDNWAGITERGAAGGNYLHFNIPASVESFSGRDPARGKSPMVRDNPYPDPCQTGRDGNPDVYPGVMGPEPLPKGRP